MSDLDDIDGMTDREIARKTYQKVCEVDERVENIEARVSANENVTEPIRRIAGSTWDKLVYALGWGVLVGLALLVYYLMHVMDKFPKT